MVGLCRRLRDAGHQAHLVGGGIRDLLLGRPPADFDVATSARPEDVLSLFGSTFAIPTGLQHGTVTVLVGQGESRHAVEVTTFRGEGAYLDGRRPSSVSYVSSLAEDLSRRDFTMNAVGYDPIDDRLTDPFDGRGDLQRRLIRAVGDPLQRFREDGLRPMRAVRQATQLEFTIDPPTLAAIGATLDVFRKVSAERIRDELFKLLAGPKPSYGLELMRTTGLLGRGAARAARRGRRHPEPLPQVRRLPAHALGRRQHPRRSRRAGDPAPRARCCTTSASRARASRARARPASTASSSTNTSAPRWPTRSARRLKLSVADRERIVAMVAHHMFFYSPDWTDGTVRRFVRRVGSDVVPALFALREGDIAGRGFGEDPDVELGELRRRIAEVAAGDAAMRITDLAIDGKDVMRILGVAPGRIVGVVLERLLERVLDDPALNDAERLSALVPEVAREAAP